MLKADLTLKRHEGFKLEAAFELAKPVTGVFGPSGAGKTTLLHILAGLERSARGTIALDDQVLQDTAARQYLPAHHRRVGVVFQDARLFPHLSIMGNLRFGLKRALRRGHDTQLTTDDIIHLLELEPLMSRRPADLSGGERRRVALGRALLSSPRLLLLDEPLSGLHISLRRQILGYLRAVQRHTAIPMLIVSHNIEEILSLTENMLLLKDGAIHGCGRYARLLEDPRALEALNAGTLTNVLSLEVQWHNDSEKLSYCHPVIDPGEPTRIAGGGRLPLVKVPSQETEPKGHTARYTLSPGDIVLSTRPQPGLGIDNQLRARVIRMIDTTPRPLCLIDAGLRLIAEVTPDAVAKLRLSPDQPLWALFRSTDLKAA